MNPWLPLVNALHALCVALEGDAPPPRLKTAPAESLEKEADAWFARWAKSPILPGETLPEPLRELLFARASAALAFALSAASRRPPLPIARSALTTAGLVLLVQMWPRWRSDWLAGQPPAADEDSFGA